MTNEAQVIDPVAALLACRQERDALAGQLAAARDALATVWVYARHQEGCSYPYGEVYGCKCGWLEVETERATLAAPHRADGGAGIDE